jgi:hypothetical protein
LKKKAEETFDPFQSRGLDDEDVSSTQPAFLCTKGRRPQVRSEPDVKEMDLKCDLSWKNNVGYTFISHRIFYYLVLALFLISVFKSEARKVKTICAYQEKAHWQGTYLLLFHFVINCINILISNFAGRESDSPSTEKCQTSARTEWEHQQSLGPVS